MKKFSWSDDRKFLEQFASVPAVDKQINKIIIIIANQYETEIYNVMIVGKQRQKERIVDH